MNNKIKIGIYGGSGYGGSELLRILLFHPDAEIVFVTANEQAGKPVPEVHRNLAGLTDLKFSLASQEEDKLAELDCVFLALPHGQAMDLVPSLPANVKAIDLSGDFRLRDQAIFEKHYKQQHTAMQ
ncbi:MAG: N-acetyl-gamma-glutamyl-phosphate reductase, partial [Acidobacteria bacterium]